MNIHSKRILPALLAVLLLMSPAALAEGITFTGTVAASQTHEVYAPIGGAVEAVEAEVGQKVAAGDALARLSTTKVYAEEAGVVTGVFGEPGDSAETVSQKYGAVMYIEGESVYSIAASTENAYNSTATKFVHVGEAVTLQCYSDGSHTGSGVITAIEGTDYTVRVTSGEFLIGETVNIYRGASTASTSRIGRGTLNRLNPTAVTGSGSIVSLAVQSGDTVQRGDLLFETLSGGFDGLYMSGAEIVADLSGTISQLNLQQGGNLDKNSVVAVLYPEGAMRVEAQVEEVYLSSIHVGDPVSIELIWNQDDEVTYRGTISMISAIATAAGNGDGDSAVTYTVYVDFTPDENTRYGMSAVVTTLSAEDEVEEADTATIEAAQTEDEDPDAADAEPTERLGGERHGGQRGDFDPENAPEGAPFGQREVNDDEEA